MPFSQSANKMVANTQASPKARSKTAGPNGSFPIGDAKHARLAIGAATRSKNAGNISASTAASIQRKARAALGENRAISMDSMPGYKKGK